MNEIPCTARPAMDCEGCTLTDRLMCRYDRADSLHFLVMAMPYFVTVIGGVILAGYGWYLLGWAAFLIIFFLGWEARFLCSHCPYWAEESRILHCHANYSVVKLWKYRPGPMSRSEQIQFAVVAIALSVYPVVFLFLGGQYLLAAIAIVSGFGWGYLLRRNVCIRCINFSCPMNAVPKTLVDAYLRQNPVMRQAWEQSGYQLD